MCDNPYLAIRSGERTKNQVWTHDVEVPCGKCPICKRRRVDDWVTRLIAEEKVSSSAYFCTFTYNTDNVPISENGFMTLNRRHFQLFMKKLRKKENAKIKYYMAAEYGTDSDRPHIHAIIFNLDDYNLLYNEERISKRLTEIWSMGNVDVRSISVDRMAYTVGYINKEKRIPVHSRDDRVKEFSRMSKNLGESYLTDEVVRYIENNNGTNGIQRNGRKMALPRYYRKKVEKLGKFNNKLYIETVQQRLLEKEEKEIKRVKKENPKRDEWKVLGELKITRHNRYYKNQKKRNGT